MSDTVEDLYELLRLDAINAPYFVALLLYLACMGAMMWGIYWFEMNIMSGGLLLPIHNFIIGLNSLVHFVVSIALAFAFMTLIAHLNIQYIIYALRFFTQRREPGDGGALLMAIIIGAIILERLADVSR